MMVNMIRNNILFFCFFLGWNILPAQSTYLNETAKEMPTFQKHYLYPSILRAIGGQDGSPMKDMVQDLKYVRILRIDSTYIVEHKFELSAVEDHLLSEGYEFMGSMYEKKSKSELYTIEKQGEIEGFIAFINEENSSLIIEIVGSIKVSKLSDLMNMDYGVFNMFLD